MARDYTKYNVEGLGENFNKRKLVFTIVKDWIEKNNPSLEELQNAFPDELQGKKGVVRKEPEVKDPKRFNMTEPLSIKNSLHVVVSNQWGDNILDFIAASEKLGYIVTANSGENGYLNYFKKQEFSNQSEFIQNTKKLFTGFSWENEKDCDEVADLHKQLNEITQSDVPRYGGYLYLFTKIAYELGEGEYDTHFEWDYAIDHGYDWWDITGISKTVVELVGEKYGESEFNKYFCSLFLLTLLKIVDDASETGIAEYIVSNNIAAYKKSFPDTNDATEDFVSDIVIELLKTIGYDIHDYEGECKIEGRYFLDIGLDMGYNYLKLAEDFRDSNI
jgi:hypothetical protein